MTELSREAILAMQPGKELDAYVAKFVMFPGHSHPLEEVKGWCGNYSTSISAAWEVMEKPEIMDHIQIGVYPTSFGKWLARSFMPGFNCTIQADTAPEAICKCVLISTLGIRRNGP